MGDDEQVKKDWKGKDVRKDGNTTSDAERADSESISEDIKQLKYANMNIRAIAQDCSGYSIIVVVEMKDCVRWFEEHHRNDH
ncbi:hypothetical protein Tco_0439912 [Tanacetum coccineum]